MYTFHMKDGTVYRLTFEDVIEELEDIPDEHLEEIMEQQRLLVEGLKQQLKSNQDPEQN